MPFLIDFEQKQYNIVRKKENHESEELKTKC